MVNPYPFYTVRCTVATCTKAEETELLHVHTSQPASRLAAEFTHDKTRLLRRAKRRKKKEVKKVILVYHPADNRLFLDQ